MINAFLNILFPESCPVCNNPASDHRTAPLCSACWQTIVPYGGPACQRCSTPLFSDVSTVCGECVKDEPAFNSVIIFSLYDGALRKALNLLKYHDVKRLSRPLSDLVSQMKLPGFEMVIPVPLHKKRLRERGFNQSALLARNISKETGTPLVLNCLVKVKDTLPQVGLSSQERWKNIRSAFKTEDISLIEGKSILLVDDVITTGATVRECSRVLKKAGAENIHVLALAHGLPD